jgi:hypothetical protein
MISAYSSETIQSWINNLDLNFSNNDNDSESTVSSSYVPSKLEELDSDDEKTVGSSSSSAIAKPSKHPNFNSSLEIPNLNESSKMLITNSEKIHIENNFYINGSLYLQNDGVQEAAGGFLENVPVRLAPSLRVVSRTSWLAQPSMIPHEALRKPVPLVIIGKLKGLIKYFLVN